MEISNNIADSGIKKSQIPIQSNAEIEARVIKFPKKSEATPSVVVGISQRSINNMKNEISNEVAKEKQSTDNSLVNKTPISDLQDKLTSAIKNKSLNINVSFEVDDKGRNIVKFVDDTTKEVIKQMPSEQALKIAESIDNFLEKYNRSFGKGLLVNDKA